MSNDRPTEEETADRSPTTGPGPLPGDDLDVIRTGQYLFYNAAAPQTQWIETDAAVELHSWV